MWMICFALAAAVLLLSGLYAAITGSDHRRLLSPSRALMVGVLVAAVILFIPIYSVAMEETGGGLWETLLLSVHNMIRLFIVDGEFSFITEHLAVEGWLYKAYCMLFAALFVLAPLMTFGFVLSFFQNVAAYRRYLLHYRADSYIFSELSEKTLALAGSIAEHKKKILFVFTDVFDQGDERSYELIERAKALGAVCFKKDIITVDLRRHSKSSALYFFTVGEDEAENVTQALKLIDTYGDRDNTHLYVRSGQVEAQLLLANNMDGKIKVRRIQEVQSLIYRNLFEKGLSIFQNAADKGDHKKITALVVGMGEHGTQMIKALSWFCQMDGYDAYIHGYDRDSAAQSKFTILAPELMEKNGNFTDMGEARYQITLHAGMDVETEDFLSSVRALEEVTYVMVSLGSDELNIKTAVNLRTLFERMGIHPIIQAIVYDAQKNRALTGITNHSGQPYDIDFIGDMRSTYSYEVVLDSELENEALARHTKWGDEEDFWKYEYNYRSSIASALHKHLKIDCGMPGADQAPAERSEEALWALRRLEHRRWNAYMRAEGYIYSPTRNNLGKTHHCLVTFDELSLKEQEKDDD